MERAAVDASLSDHVLNQLEAIVLEAEQHRQPLEVDPHRGRLFELFVMADAAGLADAEDDERLSADGICQALAVRWGLADAARESVASQTRLPAEHLARMRLLWSVIRMWMEWTYAWQRWPEFHREH